jgi:pilus assembly protein FimV
VKEPFINFLLEVSWPKGQLLKEYTVLLDPPVLMQPGTSIASNTVGVRPDPSRRTQAQPQQQAAAAQQQRQQQQRQRVIAQQQQTRQQQLQRQKQLQQQRQQAQNDGLRRPGPAGSVAPSTSGGNQSKTYRIRRGDTLFKVAKKLGYNGVRNEQMMMAIYQANPTAFRKRNINNLKAGVNVRRPSINEAKRISLRTARQDIRSQTAEWKSSSPKRSSNSTNKQIAQNGSGKTAGNNAPTKNSQARIEVLGSTNSMNSANSGNLVGQAKLDDLNRQMTLASESLTARTRENNELKSRVSELEALLKKKNRLITLKNEQLAELQVSLGQPPTAMNSNAADVEGTINEQGGEIEKMLASQDGNDGTIVRTQDPADAIINDMGQDDDFFQETVPDDISTALAPSQPVEEEGGILDLLSSPLVLGLGGGSLLALIAGFLFLRRRNSGDDEYDDYSPIDFDDPSFAPVSSDFDDVPQNNSDPVSAGDDPFAGLGGSSSAVENNFDIDPMDELIQEEEISKPAATIAPAPVSAPAINEGDVDDDGDDILQEADVYIVYGLHEQAEVELKKAIEKQPGNLEYRAKLLENYHASDNKEAFEVAATEFAQLNGPGKDELWEKVSDWGTKMLPASALFAGPGVAAAIKDSVAEVEVDAPKSDSDGLAGNLGMLGAAAAAGGVAITAGKAFAENAQEKVAETISPESDSAEVLDFDDMDLDSLLSADTQVKTEEVASIDDGLGFEDADLDSVVQDFEVDAKSDLAEESSASSDDEHEMDFDFSEFEIDDAPAVPLAEAAKSESAEFEGLEDFGDLDFDLDGIDDIDADSKMVAPNLNLALDGSNTGMGKILPENSVYKMSEAKDDILGEMDDDLSFLDLDSGADTGLMEAQVSTKLDLARAYMDMGDVEGARSTLEEVMAEGNDDQRKEAKELLTQAG